MISVPEGRDGGPDYRGTGRRGPRHGAAKDLLWAAGELRLGSGLGLEAAPKEVLLHYLGDRDG